MNLLPTQHFASRYVLYRENEPLNPSNEQDREEARIFSDKLRYAITGDLLDCDLHNPQKAAQIGSEDLQRQHHCFFDETNHHIVLADRDDYYSIERALNEDKKFKTTREQSPQVEARTKGHTFAQNLICYLAALVSEDKSAIPESARYPDLQQQLYDALVAGNKAGMKAFNKQETPIENLDITAPITGLDRSA